MKKIIVFSLLIVCLFTTINTYAQNKKKYRLELPEELQKKRIIDAVEEVLLYTLPQLKDKKYCTDCKADYTVKYQTTAQEFGTDKDGKQFFVFKSTFILYDSADNIINRIAVVNPETDNKVFYDASNNNKPIAPMPLSTAEKQKNVDVAKIKSFFDGFNQVSEVYKEELFLKTSKEKIFDIRENIRSYQKQRGRNI